MMLEPKSRQWHVVELNNIVIQNHMLSSQIAAVTAVLLGLPQIPVASTEFLNALLPQLLPAPDQPSPAVPKSLLDGNFPTLTYPLKQLHRSITLLNAEMNVLHTQAFLRVNEGQQVAVSS